MADDQAAIERRAKIETSEYHVGIRHTGTRDMLIAAGLVKPEHFPGEPGCGRTSTVFPARDGQRKIRVSRRATYLFDVVVYWTKEEREAYEAKWRARFEDDRSSAAERDQQERAAIESESTRRALADAGGPRGLAETALDVGILSIIRAFNLSGQRTVPYVFDAATVERATGLCREVVALFRSGRLEPTLGAVIQGDAEFQRFMSSTVGGALKS